MDLNDTPPSDKPARAGLFWRAPAERPTPSPPPEPKKKRSRRAGLSQISALLSFVLVGAFVGLGGFVALLVAERRDGPLAEDKTVLLTREDDDGPIADQLERAGVISSSALFSVMTLVDGERGALKRGEYAFHAGVSMREVEDMLARHRVVKRSVTIPEGLTSEQIVARLQEDEFLTGEIKETPREGSLYPDTVPFERGESRSAILSRLASEQSRTLGEIWAKRAPDLPIKSPGELVTLASIVEKETGKPDERARVAGVFINRLRKHMKLQSDPTIVYGLAFGKGTLGHSITKAELSEATPYNTYFIDGLPPGPICNPGRAAMEAVANPAKVGDLYFVADGTGGHAFAETLDQHQKNVARWRQIEKDAKDRLSPDATPPANIRGEAPDLDGSRYGALSPFAPAPAVPPVGGDLPGGKLFGMLAYANGVAPAPAAAALIAKLAKVADSRRKLATLTGAGGSLSAEKLGAGPTDQLVVTGVNDPPPGADDDALAPVEGMQVASAPLSPAALADLRARSARYGDAVASVAPVAPAGSGPRPRAFDASEGTPLDPLLNHTWDLNTAKEIPASFK